MNLRHEGYAYSLFLSQLYASRPEVPGVRRSGTTLSARYPCHAERRASQLSVGDGHRTRSGACCRRYRVPSSVISISSHPTIPYRCFARSSAMPFRADGSRRRRSLRDVFASGDFGSADPVPPRLRRVHTQRRSASSTDFYEALERSGLLLQDSWLVVTSDHGEMFERGISRTYVACPVRTCPRVPLMIFEPGRQNGVAIRTPTSAIDLLPTFAYVTGHPVPESCEGRGTAAFRYGR